MKTRLRAVRNQRETSPMPVPTDAVTRPAWKLPLLIAAGAMMLGLLMVMTSFSPKQATAAAIVVFAMACWATAALPELTTGLVFFAVATLSGVKGTHA
mgnify:CR=1 FL=1